MTNRKCGACQLCCRLLPVQDGGSVNGVPLPGSLHKAAGCRCPHQRVGKGCAVYNKPTMPVSCRMWNCRWIVNDDTADMQRPDRTHYVIDVMPDIVRLTDNRTGEVTEMEVIQVWIDPAFPEAHRDPALRRYLDRQKKGALIRYDERDSLFIVPPSVTLNGHWFERRDRSTDEFPTSVNRLAAVMGAQVILGEPDPVTGMIRSVMLMPDGKHVPLALQDRENLK